MKKLLATLLAAGMMLSLVPAFATSAAEATVDGLTQTSYHMAAKTSAWDNAYKWLMGRERDNAQVNYDDMKRFDTTHPDLMYWSYKTNSDAKAVTDFQLTNDGLARELGAPNGDNYMLNWTGTMTASKDATFTLVGNKIDNGFVFEIGNTRYYEWWGSSHWFDGDGDRLPAEKSITVQTGKTYKVNVWFLELTGGDNLVIGAYEGDSTELVSLADLGLTFDLSVNCYHADVDRWGDPNNDNHPYVKVFIDAGHKKGTGSDGQFNGGNGAQCIEDNFMYNETIKGLLKASKQIGGEVITPLISTWTPAVNDESYINIYNGFVTVPETGYYLFGCTQVDNGFYMEIDGKTVFELWANGTWQDNEVDSWYTTPIKLEAGKQYPLYAAYLELDGGNVLDPVVKFSTTEDFSASEVKNMNDVLSYKTTVPTDTDMLSPAAAATIAKDGTLLTSKIKADSVNCSTGQWDDGKVANIFDGDPATKLGSTVKDNFGTTITWQTTEPTTVTHYSIMTALDDVGYRRIPTGWALSGSNDGVNYTVIDYVERGMTGLGCSSNQTGTYSVDDPEAYTYYKLVMNTCWWGGDAVSFAELALYNHVAPVDEPDKPDPVPSTGDAMVYAVVATVATLSLGAVVVCKKRRIAE